MLERYFEFDDEGQALRLAYLEWPHSSPKDTIVCLHGLSRNSHDFERLAEHLASDYRVLAVDVVGRGRSSWLEDPARYVVPTYVGHLWRFLSQPGLNRVTWVGTSMGGIMGMALAAQPGNPIHRLILNDIGAFISRESTIAIADYLKATPSFPNFEAAEHYLRTNYAGFGTLSDVQWQEMTRHSVRVDKSVVKLHYDPALVTPFEDLASEDADLWGLYEAIRCPVLLLHGEESAILTEATAQEMTRRGPKATLIGYAGIGHAPSLMVDGQIDDIRNWLAQTPPLDA